MQASLLCSFLASIVCCVQGVACHVYCSEASDLQAVSKFKRSLMSGMPDLCAESKREQEKEEHVCCTKSAAA